MLSRSPGIVILRLRPLYHCPASGSESAWTKDAESPTFPNRTRSAISQRILFYATRAADLCIRCTPSLEYSIRTDVRPVGVLAGYHIVDALYYVSPGRNSNSDQVKWKSILVQTGPDLYREIFHLQVFYASVSLTPSRIIQSGSESVLATMDSDGGNGGGCWEGYWWFDQAGPPSA